MRAALWLSSSSDSSSDELGGEKTDGEHHHAPRIITGARSISPPEGLDGTSHGRLVHATPGGGNDNKLTRAKVERKGWVGAGISHRTARTLGAPGARSF